MTTSFHTRERVDPSPRSLERIQRNQLIHRARLLRLDLVLVEVAVHLVDAVVELVEVLVPLRVEQVRAGQADRKRLAETLLDEGLEVGAVAGFDFLGEQARLRLALAAVARAERD